MTWITRKINIKLPSSEKPTYSDCLIYLVKVLDQMDPRYEYVLGLAGYAISKGLSKKQSECADEIINHYIEKGILKFSGEKSNGRKKS